MGLGNPAASPLTGMSSVICQMERGVPRLPFFPLGSPPRFPAQGKSGCQEAHGSTPGCHAGDECPASSPFCAPPLEWEEVAHLLDDVQQAVEVVGVAALGQVHQQLGGQLTDLVVFIVGDVSQLGDDHQVDQLFLQEGKTIRGAGRHGLSPPPDKRRLQIGRTKQEKSQEALGRSPALMPTWPLKATEN